MIFQAFVGYKGRQHYHVFELTRQLPRFSMYCVLLEPSNNPKPDGHVTFHTTERSARVALWLNQNFLMGEELEPDESGINIGFSSLRKRNEEMYFKMTNDGMVKLNANFNWSTRLHPVMTGTDHCFDKCRTSVRLSVPTFQNLAKQNKFKAKTTFTNGVTVGLVEWIIDDTCLIDPRPSTNQSTSLKVIHLIFIVSVRTYKTKQTDQRVKPLFKLVLW